MATVVIGAFQLTAAEVSDVKFKALDGFGGDVGAVVSRCQTKVGSEYDPITVTRDVTSLKDSGEFEEVSADAHNAAGGIEVVFYVKRKLRFVAPLEIHGNDYFGESKIAKESELKDGELYGLADLEAAAAKVRKAYVKKYYSDVEIEVTTKEVSGNNVNVVFNIKEGERGKIADFVFKGADHVVKIGTMAAISPFFELGADQIDESELREAIADYPWWNPIGWFTDAQVTRDQLAQCCDKLAEVYRNHGYLDVKVTGPERERIGEGEVKVVFEVSEGEQYHIGDISIKGLTKYSEAEVKSRSDLPAAGAIAAMKTLNEAADRVKITVGSGDLGLADTRVTVKYLPSEVDNSTVNLIFQVVEGVPVVLNDIIIRGNDYTKDRVIRREIALGPGDRMLEDRADRSKKRLENLDYFARVNYYLEPTDLGKDEHGAERRNLVYEVEEKNTGSFMVGIGASSVDSVYVSAEVNQNNFDLFAPSKLFRGAGQKGRVYVAWGPRYQSMEAGVVEPYFLDRTLELSVDGYRRMRWYDEYDLYRSGASASLAYPVKFWPTWEAFGRLGLGLSGEYIEFDDVESGEWYKGKNEDRVYSFRQEEKDYGDAMEPVLHFFWAKDSRDNFRIPTSGHRTKLFLDLAPAGDNEYWRLGFNHRSYFNVWKRYNHVLMIGLRAETIEAITDEVPIYNRMFLGGPRTIRGVEYRNVAPLVHKGNDYAPWGGQTLFCANFEYTVPIVKMLRLAAFSDLGSVGEDDFDLDFDDTFAWTVGLGVRLDIPMFPIRLDFATPIEKPDHADEEVFSFTVGYDF